MRLPARIPPEIIRPAGPWRHRDITANGARFHIVESLPSHRDRRAGGAPAPASAPLTQSEADLPVVLLLHGFAQFWRAWHDVIPALCDIPVRIIAPDLRGCGGSDKQPAGYDLLNLARDCVGIIRAAGATSATVVGHGIGGQIGWTMAHAFPEAVTRLVTVASPHPVATRSLRSRAFSGMAAQFAFLQLPALPERLARSGALINRITRTWTAPANRERLAGLGAIYTPVLRMPQAAAGALAHVRTLRTISRSTRAALTGRVEVPVTSIQGQVDPITPAQAFSRDGHFVAGPIETFVIPNCGHLIPEEAPTQLAQILRPILTRP